MTRTTETTAQTRSAQLRAAGEVEAADKIDWQIATGSVEPGSDPRDANGYVLAPDLSGDPTWYPVAPVLPMGALSLTTTIRTPKSMDERSAIRGDWTGDAADVPRLVVAAVEARGLTADEDEVVVRDDGSWELPAFVD